MGSQPDVLRQILEADVNLSLWQRAAQPAIEQEVAALKPSHLPDRRYPTSRDSFVDDVDALLQSRGLDPVAFQALRTDLGRLATLFFDVSESYAVKFRLISIDGDNCRRFHVDTRHLRLLCTYRGPGTEWLSEAQVDRVALERGAPNAAITRFGKPSVFERFWVGIMKGDPEREGFGLVHRSPSIAGSVQTRVVFSLDAEP
jgi:hypothetical protein